MKTLTERLIAEMAYGHDLSLALLDPDECLIVATGDIPELAERWPVAGAWRLCALDNMTGDIFACKNSELQQLVEARLALDSNE